MEKQEQYTTLPEVSKQPGRTNFVLSRVGKIALVKSVINQGSTSYEVHIVRVRPMAIANFKNPDGTTRTVNMEAKEILAGDSEFGKYAWSFGSLQHAQAKFNEMIAQHE